MRAKRLAKADDKCWFERRGAISPAAAASGAPGPAPTGPASPLRPWLPRSPPPPLYLRCWGWPGGSGAQRTGEGKSRGGPCEVRSSSRPETRGCWGGRRRRPGAAGVPQPGAPSSASSLRRLRRRCPAPLSSRLPPRGGGERGSRLLLVPRGLLCLLARGSSKCGNQGSSETAEVCSRLPTPSSTLGLNEILVTVDSAVRDRTLGCREGPASCSLPL